MTYISADERRPEIVAAARRVCVRDGLAKLSLRRVAEEAGIALGTMQHVFRTREMLLRAVVEDVDADIAAALRAGLSRSAGLAGTLRAGITNFWDQMVADQVGLQLLQYELTLTTLRTEGLHELASWQYRRYIELTAKWCQEAAEAAGETIAIDYDALARVILASIDGLILQYVVDPDPVRAKSDLDMVIGTLTALAAPSPAD
ncbi:MULTISPECIES: TetR/AcrR family transcriptional regulator [unclassified Streptomyces]|uniref:TetR/AcrR family transcriptional regulator n=1 Tax=unclassified Streptomyces TaxID=2593676 RepID=UPI002E2FDA08|nr:TetR family transcriptional regulator C-terminal domain-containing protein [Streptomyces sp. NBC_01477]